MFHVKQKREAFRSPAGACLLCRLLTLPLVCFFAPIPLPPLAGGKGEIFGFLMQGAPPLASPGLSPGGAGSVGGLAPPAPLLQKLRSTDIPSGRNHLNITGSTLVNAYL